MAQVAKICLRLGPVDPCFRCAMFEYDVVRVGQQFGRRKAPPSMFGDLGFALKLQFLQSVEPIETCLEMAFLLPLLVLDRISLGEAVALERVGEHGPYDGLGDREFDFLAILPELQRSIGFSLQKHIRRRVRKADGRRLGFSWSSARVAGLALPEPRRPGRFAITHLIVVAVAIAALPVFGADPAITADGSRAPALNRPTTLRGVIPIAAHAPIPRVDDAASALWPLPSPFST